MKIGIVEPVGNYGGMDHYNYGLLSGLSETECEVCLYTSGTNLIGDELVNSEVKTFYQGVYQTGATWLKGLKFLGASIRTVNDAKRQGMGLLHFHFFQLGFIELVNVLLTRWAGLLPIATIHDVNPLAGSSSQVVEKRLLGQLAGVITHNKLSQQALVAKDIPLPDAQTIIPPVSYTHLTLPTTPYV